MIKPQQSEHAPAHKDTLLNPPDLSPVTLDDREVFSRAIGQLREPISDASFAASLCWSEPLGLGWAEIEGHLCLFSSADHDLSMMLPPLELDPGARPRLGVALGACFEIMDTANESSLGIEQSRIEYVSDELLPRVLGAKGNDLRSSEMPGDYVYQRAALVELAGGPLKNKRKLRSKFLREQTDITTGPIQQSDIAECLGLLDKWREHADEEHEGEANERLQGVDILRERDAACTRRYLEVFEQLGLRTMAVRSAGRLIGFTIGERLTDSMGVVCVEKTLPDAAGAPQFIYSEFCRTQFADVQEINAGDDWGIPSLRFTKSSYRPTRMLGKHVVTRAERPQTGTPEPAVFWGLRTRPAWRGPYNLDPLQGIVVRKAERGDAPGIVRVEGEAFTDENDRFYAAQITRLIANPRARVCVAQRDGEIVGWCVALIRTHAKWRSGRVYSVAVLPSMSGRGVGRKMLNWSLERLENDGVRRVYLEVRERNEGAIALYTSLGFEPMRLLPDYYGEGEHGLRMRRVR